MVEFDIDETPAETFARITKHRVREELVNPDFDAEYAPVFEAWKEILGEMDQKITYLTDQVNELMNTDGTVDPEKVRELEEEQEDLRKSIAAYAEIMDDRVDEIFDNPVVFDLYTQFSYKVHMGEFGPYEAHDLFFDELKDGGFD